MNVSADINLSTTYNNKRKRFINYKSRRQPFVLCQVQDFRSKEGLEGFKPLNEAGIHPTKEIKAAIKDFALPQTVKSMRAFMGLIAQVGWTLDTKTRELMYQLRNKLRGCLLYTSDAADE